MANLLKGKDVAFNINENNKIRIDELKSKGVTPCLAIFRIGEKDSDLSYEKGIEKKADELGIKIQKILFKDDVSEKEFLEKIDEVNNDKEVHGILIFRPLPKCFNDDIVRNRINPNKDVDGCSDGSLAGIFVNKKYGFAPCTAEAVIKILDYYNIDVSGKNITVLGRSLVIGKPLSMLLLNRNATVTICHTKTKEIENISKNADILVCATGIMESVNKSYVKCGQIIIDVGVKFNQEKNKLCGDVLFEDVENIVDSITPVPGGVGSVTTSLLMEHVTEACIRMYE